MGIDSINHMHLDLTNLWRKYNERHESELLRVKNLERDDIRGSGYVVRSLIASIWCLLHTNSYKEAVLEAVNLGEDTDTTAAIVGGIAGLYYGVDDIPKEWLVKIAKLDYIEELITNFDSFCENSD